MKFEPKASYTESELEQLPDFQLKLVALKKKAVKSGGAASMPKEELIAAILEKNGGSEEASGEEEKQAAPEKSDDKPKKTGKKRGRKPGSKNKKKTGPSDSDVVEAIEGIAAELTTIKTAIQQVDEKISNIEATHGAALLGLAGITLGADFSSLDEVREFVGENLLGE